VSDRCEHGWRLNTTECPACGVPSELAAAHARIAELEASNALLQRSRGKVIDSLVAECDSLRANANRYLWLRDKSRSIDWHIHIARHRGSEDMDAAIDARL
jgi:hypothetical protein